LKGKISEFDLSESAISFYIEQPADWLTFKFNYERPHTWRYMNLRDPEGRIRLSHVDVYNNTAIIIHVDPAQSSYLAVPGSISAGEWRVEFAEVYETGAHTIKFEWQTGSSGENTFDIDFPVSEREFWTDAVVGKDHYELHYYDWNASRENTSRWYKGDFHTHTVLSDGKMTPERNMEQAEIMGLDFFVATDHNLLSTSWPKGKTLVIPGNEFTSDYGHWNALGLRQWIDWRANAADGGIGTQQGMQRVMEEAGQQGALRSINHPMLTPWAWMYGETPLNFLDALEIWNDPTYHTNPAATEKALILWSTLWNEGYQITGIGGSDSHLLPEESYGDGNPPSLIGDPATYVYADRLSTAAILTAVRKGRVYVSRIPVLDICVTVDDVSFPLGSDLTEAVNSSPDGNVYCSLTVMNCSEGTLRVIENGEVVSHLPVSNASRTFEFKSAWKEKAYIWRRYEIRAINGDLLAFTNPVFYGEKTQEITTWKQLLEKSSFDVPVN
jgi:hypothetical protein